MYRFSIGAIEVIKITESLSPAVEPLWFLPGLTEQALERYAPWLEPVFYDKEEKKLILSGHAWLLKTPEHTILIEACAGNHKPRPTFPRGNMLNTRWLDLLGEAGVRPEDIDYVMCTHLHVDHVGWFTTKQGDVWIPTFPNATYLVDRLEYDNWNPATRQLAPLQINENAFEDSVTPVMASGKMKLIDPPFEVEHGIEIVPARGHTLGHVAIRVLHGTEGAYFVGDLVHTPLQIVHPEFPTYACEDLEAAVASHREFLGRCADEGRLFVPTHFPEPWSAVRIERRGEGFIFLGLDGLPPKGLLESLDGPQARD